MAGRVREVRVALIGAGRAGMVHGANFAAGIAGARLMTVADPDAAACERAAAELGCATCHDPIAAATGDDVDAVVVAGPTFTHAETVIAALGAGKHVLCEKPLASTLVEADAIARAVAEATGTLLMGFMRRFDAGFARAAHRIEAGDIGRPVLVRSTTRGPGLPPEWAWDPSRSGGLVAEVNSHDLDTVRHLSGQDLTAVYAAGRAAKRPDIRSRYPGFVDVVAAIFDLSDGALAQVDGACPADYGYDARAEVYGTEGTILVGGPAAHTAVLVRDRAVETDPVRSWRDLFAAAYQAEDAHFAAVARGEAEPRASVEDGVAAIRAVEAVNRSLAEDRKVAFDEVGGSGTDRAGTGSA